MTWVVGLALRYRKPNMEVSLSRTEFGSSSFRRIVIILDERRIKNCWQSESQGRFPGLSLSLSLGLSPGPVVSLLAL